MTTVNTLLASPPTQASGRGSTGAASGGRGALGVTPLMPPAASGAVDNKRDNPRFDEALAERSEPARRPATDAHRPEAEAKQTQQSPSDEADTSSREAERDDVDQQQIQQEPSEASAASSDAEALLSQETVSPDQSEGDGVDDAESTRFALFADGFTLNLDLAPLAGVVGQFNSLDQGGLVPLGTIHVPGLAGDATSLLTLSLNAGPGLGALVVDGAMSGSSQGTAPSLITAAASSGAEGGPINPLTFAGSGDGAAGDQLGGNTSSPNSSATAGGVASPGGSVAGLISAFESLLAPVAGNDSSLPAPGVPAPGLVAAPASLPASAALGEATPDADRDALNTARLHRGLNSALNQQGGNVTLRLTPPDLGTVRIQLNLQGANVTAQFHAETESARTLLTQQLAQLKSSLEAQGLNVEKIGVQAMSGTQNASQLNQQHQSGQQSQQHADADGRSRGQHQQSPGQQQSHHRDDAQEERARGNLAAARDLFSDLLMDDPAAA